MHKPPLAMWQMSAFIATMGESTFWLRFPSVLLGAASCVLTLLIGRRLFDTQTGCIAGVMQAWLAATWMLAHGYQFSDHIDTALVFYVELSILFVVGWMNKRSQSAIILAGVTCGLAVLTKSFVGLTPLAMVVVLALISRDAKRVGDAITMTCATVLTAAPWLAWCWVMFPDEFLASKELILKHLSSEVELWGGPWDRVAFDYWPRLFYPWFVALAGLGIVGTIDAIRARDTKWLIVWLWFAVVAIPHLLAPTKTPSATVTLLPAGLIMLAVMVSRRPTLAMLSLASCVVVEVGFNVTATFGPAGVFSVVLSNWPWVLAIAILIAARWVVPEWRHARLGLAGLFSVLLLMSVRASTRVTQIETPDV